MKKKNQVTQETPQRDELVELLANELNKANKDGGKIAYFLDEQENPADISDWISTGSSMLDLAISNRPHGGLPVGKMVEFNGLEGTGKSLVSAHVVADTQKKGGVAVVIDTENAAAPEFWKSLGVDLSKLLYVQCETVEDIFEQMEKMIGIVRKSNKDRILTIIVDSVAAASTKAELESDHGKDGFATGKSIIISKAMRKITNMIGKQKVLTVFTNQLRQNLNAMAFGDKWVVSGGKSLAYHCSVRVRLNNTGKLKKGEEVIGNECKAVVIKNRMGPPQRQASFDIYFDSGIADYGSWIKVLKENNLVKQGGAYYTYKKDDGNEWKFQSKDFVETMKTDKVLSEEVYLKICDAVVMKYKDPNSVIVDDAVVDTEEDAGVSSENE
ncbi:MAG: Recombinase [Bacteroidota bacterium]|jgi:recombination protein RecA